MRNLRWVLSPTHTALCEECSSLPSLLALLASTQRHLPSLTTCLFRTRRSKAQHSRWSLGGLGWSIQGIISLPVQNSILCSVLQRFLHPFIRSMWCLKKSALLYANSEVPRVTLLMKGRKWRPELSFPRVCTKPVQISPESVKKKNQWGKCIPCTTKVWGPHTSTYVKKCIWVLSSFWKYHHKDTFLRLYECMVYRKNNCS